MKEKEVGVFFSLICGIDEYRTTALNLIKCAKKSLWLTCIFPPSFWFKGDVIAVKNNKKYFDAFKSRKDIPKKRLLITDVYQSTEGWECEESAYINLFLEKNNIFYNEKNGKYDEDDNLILRWQKLKNLESYFGDYFVIDEKIVLTLTST